jgi:hypothetical protein
LYIYALPTAPKTSSSDADGSGWIGAPLACMQIDYCRSPASEAHSDPT